MVHVYEGFNFKMEIFDKTEEKWWMLSMNLRMKSPHPKNPGPFWAYPANDT